MIFEQVWTHMLAYFQNFVVFTYHVKLFQFKNNFCTSLEGGGGSARGCLMMMWESLTYVLLLYYNFILVGFGFVAFDSKDSVEKTANIHYHQISGKTV